MNKTEKWKAKQKSFKQNVPHKFNKKVLNCPWWYCSGCGLVALNNDATRKAMQRPCNSMET